MQKYNHNQPLVSFDFANREGEVIPRTYRDPVKVICATHIEEVIPALHAVQKEVDAGYHAAGFLSYESAPAFDAAYHVKKGQTMPLLWFGIYNEPQFEALQSTGTFKLKGWTADTDREAYMEAIESIRQKIKQGDTYQTNYTIRLKSEFRGDDIALFDRMKRAQACQYSAYMYTGEHSVLSASPELFFRMEDEKITTRPMKGTVKRGRTVAEDETLADWLYHSEKNRAENVMIVDLLRNDLGKVAKTGTVEVSKLFDIERYPTVHQMTSTVEAELREGTDLIEVFRALFPCGSITGAPKVSTMDLISEVETAPREVYCGAIGFITPEKEAVFNVPIRTVHIDHQSGIATYGVGGGITWDSSGEEEYDEILAKSSFLEVDRPRFHLLESLLLEDSVYFLKEDHLDRLEQSAAYFSYPFNRFEAVRQLEQLAKWNPQGAYKVRCLVGNDGTVETEIQELNDTLPLPEVVLATASVDRLDPFLYHKTTHRSIYEEHAVEGVFDVLLWNGEGELTEFINGNVVLEIEDEWFTPPVESGLLAGTYRNRLLEQEIIREKKLYQIDLARCTKVWLINSVRKWVEVTGIQGPSHSEQ